jgi:hypothetical protein
MDGAVIINDHRTSGLRTYPPAVVGGAVVGDPLRVVCSLAFLSTKLQGTAIEPERGVADEA